MEPPPCARVGQEAFMRTCEPCPAASKTAPETFASVAREVSGDPPLQENTELRVRTGNDGSDTQQEQRQAVNNKTDNTTTSTLLGWLFFFVATGDTHRPRERQTDRRRSFDETVSRLRSMDSPSWPSAAIEALRRRRKTHPRGVGRPTFFTARVSNNHKIVES